MSTTPAPRQKIPLQRHLDASVDDVWELWTTREGIEAWWGPEGFTVTVEHLDIRPQGNMRYTMNAVAAEMVAFMKANGMPTSTPHTVTFLEVIPYKVLVFESLADFIPGVEPYPSVTRVEFLATATGVTLHLLLEAMHDAVWTQRMAAGWESELTKLERLLQSTTTQDSTFQEEQP